jgi:RimJ/RimL family protein N-acetyltransferase
VEETEAWLSQMIKSKETNGITDFVILLWDGASESISTAQFGTIPATTDAIGPSQPNAGPVIGKIGIYASVDSSRSGEIGFLLRRSYQRRGLVSEALSAVIGYLFEQRGVEAITTDVDPRNEASIGILKNFGFVLTGRAQRTFEIGGEWVDSEYRTLMKSGWESMQGA